jgi:hypothetical protein
MPKQPWKTDPKTGKIIGAKYISQEELDKKSEYQGEADPEAAKAVAKALGFPQVASWIDQAQAGKNPLESSNISVLKPGQLPGDAGTASVGDDAKLVSSDRAKLEEIRRKSEAQSNYGQDTVDFSNSTENVLYKFATVNHLWKLACLTPNQVNSPDKTYRRNGPDPVLTVIDSSGRTITKKAQVAAEKQYNITTGYYIDNVEVDSVIAPNPKTRQTNAVRISFEVREPYSMGQFLQSLMISAKRAGYEHYLQSPFLLECTFIGYDTNGNLLKDSQLKRQYPLKLITIDFEVDDQGSVYKLGCVPFNEQALEDTAQSTKQDFTISGKDLQETLQTGLNSLATHINTSLLKIKAESKEKAEVDEYVIAFPSDTSSASLDNALKGVSNSGTATTGDLALKEFNIDEAFSSVDSGPDGPTGYTEYYNQQVMLDDMEMTTQTIKKSFIDGRLGYSVKRGDLSESLKSILASPGSDCNNIGKASLLPDAPIAAGNMPFGLTQFVYNPTNGLLEKGAVVIDPKVRTITFKAGTKIQKIIEECILLSDYGKNIFKAAKKDALGMINWFKIDTQVYIVDDKESEKVYGRKPYLYVYRVIPHKVHKSQFQMPNDPPVGFNKLVSEAVRRYNYIYTGKNKDILSFNLEFNNAFYEAIQIDGKGNSGSDSAQAGNIKETDQTKAEMQGSITSRTGDGSVVKRVNQDLQKDSAGSFGETTAINVARAFNEAIINSSGSMITINMEILGDPYYLADSGMGNYNAEATNFMNVNIDGSVDYQSSEVDILINFRTPIDLNPESGTYLMDGEAVGVKDFSGLYKVITVTSKFSENIFTQQLTCNRRKNYQLKDFEEQQQELALAAQKKYEKAVAEALETGDPDLIAFAKADKNADGSLSTTEAVAADLTDSEAIALAQRASKATSLGEQQSQKPVTADDGFVGPPLPPESNQTTTLQPQRTGGAGNDSNDAYYNYGRNNRT